MNPDHPILRAAKIAGSQVALAKFLKTTKQNINIWLGDDVRVPAKYCPDIEKLTNGSVRCEELNPDVNWAVLRNSTGKVSHA